MSTKTANLAKQIVQATTDLTMMAKKKQLKWTLKSKTGKEHFNYRKKGHYAKDCCSFTLNKRKPKELSEEAKCI